MVNNMQFPIFKTKMDGGGRFDLINPEVLKDYFQFKAGPEIEKIREYLKESGFVIYLLGKKNSGKGTYSKMFASIVAPDKVEHFSVGDMVRGIDEELKDENKRKELISFLEKNYRGRYPLEEIISSLESRSTQKLLPTELILALTKRELAQGEKRAVFIDGFPRELDQISYSLFFRDLIGFRDDPDIFVLIDVPTSVIDARIKYRRICPLCKTSRNLRLLPTSKVSFDKAKNEFHLMCDNADCLASRDLSKGDKEIALVQKEGDELGTEPIKERLALDKKLIEMAFSLYGIPKVLLRNTIPVKEAKEAINDYEITPQYDYEWEEKEGKVIVKESPWVIQDDDGIDSYSLLPAPVVVSLIRQVSDALGL
ncbi:MAG: Adenylate kinase [Parcubacteria group bacterium GW2011_GWC1_38_6]|nr:MAG: Adenylate kinase [Parcubacteria group bacterium GW2011_GWC1_38_6]